MKHSASGELVSGQAGSSILLAADDNEYRRQLLSFHPMELGLDERVRFVTLAILWGRAVFWSLLTALLFAIIGGISLAISVAGDASTGAAPSNLNFGIFYVGIAAAVIVFWIVFLFGRRPEAIAEWRSLLEGKANAAASAYATIYGTLSARAIPVRVKARRIRTDVLSREVVNNRLIISDRSYFVYVSVFGYGTSLYVGWMMWRNRRGATLAWTMIKNVLGDPLGRTGTIKQMMRTERVRAMREAVHAAVREGVDVAVIGSEVSIAATFGHELAIDTGAGSGNEAMAVPMPVPMPVPVPMPAPMSAPAGYPAPPPPGYPAGYQPATYQPSGYYPTSAPAATEDPTTSLPSAQP